MAIDVLCPGCKKRFKVSDQFAGQKGPCPNCKAIITIPEKGDEVVVHAPEEFGPKDASGRATLKPIQRKETDLTLWMAVALAAVVLLVLGAAIAVRVVYGDRDIPAWILAMGAVLLAPPLSWSGYTFLRETELEPHRGRSLLVRTLICSAAYSLLWGLYWNFPPLTGMADAVSTMEPFQLIFLVPPIVLLGGLAGFACYDLDFGTGVLHYAYYLVVTILISLIAGVELFQYQGLFG